MNNKVKISLILVLAVAGGVSYFVTMDRDSVTNVQDTNKLDTFAVSSNIEEADKAGPDGASIGNAEDLAQNRAAAMNTAFSQLQDSRKLLKSRANLLKSKVWGLQLPPAEAKKLTNSMKQAYAYLKNPSMLGAYFSVADIEKEIRSVNAMLENLDEVEKIISSNKDASES